MKIGDKVRFLSETGGGRISGFQGHNIVLVEDEDGFEIPMATNDIVVIQSDDYSIAKTVTAKQTQTSAPAPEGASIKELLRQGVASNDPEFDTDPSEGEITFRAPVEERKGGNKLSAYLAFVPITPKEFTTSRFETYIVNDSNYYLRYTLMVAEGNSWQLHHEGEIEPNTKEFIVEIGREDLNDFEHLSVQMLAYKREKSFIRKPVVDVQLRLDNVKFYKYHAFEENDFFEQPSLILTLVENDEQPLPFVVDAKRLKQEMYNKVKEDAKPAVQKPVKQNKNEVLVVDLHAHELLDTTAGMSNGDILEYQLKTFRDTLNEHASEKNKKIIFIHGKGDGVLRNAIVSELKYKFKRYQYQDASFQEYGYGATQVTIK